MVLEPFGFMRSLFDPTVNKNIPERIGLYSLGFEWWVGVYEGQEVRGLLVWVAGMHILWENDCRRRRNTHLLRPGGWQNIQFGELPGSLRPEVVKIMQSVYLHANPTAPPPSADRWWNDPSIGYQVDGESPEPSIVILNLREGLSDHPSMNTHFMVNLSMLRVHDKFKNVKFPVPEEAVKSARVVFQYVRRLLRDKKLAADMRKAQEVERKNKEREKYENMVKVRSPFSLYSRV